VSRPPPPPRVASPPPPPPAARWRAASRFAANTARSGPPLLRRAGVNQATRAAGTPVARAAWHRPYP
jgi:hypothetical protein